MAGPPVALLQLLPGDLGKLHKTKPFSPSSNNPANTPPPQIPSLASFSPQCLGLVTHIPLWIAVVTVALRYGIGPVWNICRPSWLRRFAAEEDVLPVGAADQESGAGRAPVAMTWTRRTLCLLLLSIGAAALGAIGVVVRPEYAQIFLMPVLPSVCCLLGLPVPSPLFGY